MRQSVPTTPSLDANLGQVVRIGHLSRDIEGLSSTVELNNRACRNTELGRRQNSRRMAHLRSPNAATAAWLKLLRVATCFAKPTIKCGQSEHGEPPSLEECFRQHRLECRVQYLSREATPSHCIRLEARLFHIFDEDGVAVAYAPRAAGGFIRLHLLACQAHKHLSTGPSM